MKIEFRFSEMWQKGFLIYDWDAPGMGCRKCKTTFMFDPNLRRIAEARILYKILSDKYSRKELLKPLIKEEKPEHPEMRKIYELIEEVQLSEIEEIKGIAYKVINILQRKARFERFASIVKDMFGVDTPKEFLVYVVYSIDGGGNFVYDNVVTLRVNEGILYHGLDGVLDVLIHELLHSCLDPFSLKNEFEEALLSFLAPRGIVSERLGIRKRKFRPNVYKYKNEEYKKWYDTLEPVMKRYEGGNLFEFLEENGIEIPKENKNK